MSQKPELFDLKWKDFGAHLAELSSSLLHDSSLLDISIQCGTEVVRAHKLVLSACSPWFREVITNMQTNPNPLVVLWETKMVDMKNILSFMYNGEVQFEHASLLSFLKLAGYLQVKGLTQGNEKNGEVEEKVLEEENEVIKKPKVDDPRPPQLNEPITKETARPREISRSRETSRPSSRVNDVSRSRKETVSETRLRKEDFDFELKERKKANEPSEEKAGKVEKTRSEFDIKSDYERVKIKEMRVKEVMRNAGKDRSFDRQQKKKTNVRKESLGQELKAYKNSFEKPSSTFSNDQEEALLQAMLERKSMLEKISNAPLSRFEASTDDMEFNPDFDPSLLVKAEIDETMEEEVLDTSVPPIAPFNHSPTPISKPNGDMCTICGKGPFAKGKVTQHMKNVHSGMAYECTTCVKTFKCERYLQNHKRQYCPDRFKQ